MTIKQIPENPSTIKPILNETAIDVLNKRYLLKDEKGNVIETPAGMLWRVAYNIAEAEKNYINNNGEYDSDKYDNLEITIDEDKIVLDKAVEFYEMMAKGEFLPNSPTLMNAGTPDHMLSACFVLPIADSMDSIFSTIKNTAMIHKQGGGCIAKGSYVTTSKGRKKIEDVSIGDFVYSVNEKTHEWSLNEVIKTHTYSPKNKKILKISLQHKTDIVTTDWHPFGVLKEKGIEWIRADKLQKDDLIISGANEKFALDDFCWSLGLIASDGYFNKGHITSGGNTVYDGLTLCKSNEKIVEKLASILDINYRLSSDKRYKSDVWELSTSKKEIIDKYKKFYFLDGKWKKSKDMRIPSDVFGMSYSQRVSFVVGLLDGDGTYNKEKGYFSYSTISNEFGQDLMSLLSTIGIESTYRIVKPRKTNWNAITEVNFKCVHGLIEEIAKATVRYNSFDMDFESHNAVCLPFNGYREALDINTGQARTKQEIFGKMISLNGWYNNKKIAKANANHIAQSLPDINTDWTNYLLGTKKVVSIDDNEEVDLYDLTVKDSATYLASTNGSPVVIHNTGFSFSNLRPSNDIVRSTSGISSGPISFMGVFDKATDVVSQAGKRRGANMGILRIDHPDIMDFIKVKSDLNKLNNFNLSIAITDDFMQAVKDNTDYDIINPRNNKVITRYDARLIFDLIVKQAWTSGEPGLIFIEEINRMNPTNYYCEIEATNPCGELPLESYNSCNLGSINLSKCYNEKLNDIDYTKLHKLVYLGVNFLDNVIDVNKYPLKKIDETTKLYRKIGLGVMGFADLLLKMKIPYSSQKALELAEHLMKYINDTAYSVSIELGKERGVYPVYSDEIQNNPNIRLNAPCRNAARTTVAPTGTISILAGCSSGIEPIFSLAFMRNIMDDDEFFEVNPVFNEISKINNFYLEHIIRQLAKDGTVKHVDGIPDEHKLYLESAHDISPEAHVKMQATFQKHIDSSISKTINFPSDATEEDVRNAYMMAYELKCKGITIYRDGCRQNQVLNIGENVELKEEKDSKELNIEKRIKKDRPSVLKGSTYEMETGCGKLFVTINEDSDGNVFENFNTIGKAGGCASSQCEAIGRLISLALRSGQQSEEIIKSLVGISCHKPFGFGDNKVLSCADAIAKAFIKHVSLKDNNDEEQKNITEYVHMYDSSSGACPECGGAFEHEGGCGVCHSCGFSQCG